MQDDIADQQPLLPEKLRQFRKEAGLSVQQLADKNGTPAYTLRRDASPLGAVALAMLAHRDPEWR